MSFSDSLKGQLDLLPSLLAILEERNISRAADRMGVTQPAMSRSLAQLRDLLTDRLIERSGSGMVLTPRGEALIPSVRNLLKDAHSLFQPEAFSPSSTELTFRIALPDVIAHYALPPLLSAFQERAPNAELILTPWREAIDNQYADDISFAVTTEPELFAGWRMQRAFSDHDVLVHADPLDKKTDPLSLPHVAVIPSGLHRDPVDAWLDASGYERLISVSVPYYSLATDLIQTTGNVAILPRRLAQHLAATRNLLWTDFWPDQTPDPVWLLYPKQLEDDPASSWLRQLAMNVLRAL